VTRKKGGGITKSDIKTDLTYKQTAREAVRGGRKPVFHARQNSQLKQRKGRCETICTQVEKKKGDQTVETTIESGKGADQG